MKLICAVTAVFGILGNVGGDSEEWLACIKKAHHYLDKEEGKCFAVYSLADKTWREGFEECEANEIHFATVKTKREVKGIMDNIVKDNLKRGGFIAVKGTEQSDTDINTRIANWYSYTDSETKGHKVPESFWTSNKPDKTQNLEMCGVINQNFTEQGCKRTLPIICHTRAACRESSLPVDNGKYINGTRFGEFDFECNKGFEYTGSKPVCDIKTGEWKPHAIDCDIYNTPDTSTRKSAIEDTTSKTIKTATSPFSLRSLFIPLL